jgi:hypothetical protein
LPVDDAGKDERQTTAGVLLLFPIPIDHPTALSVVQIACKAIRYTDSSIDYVR